MNSAVQINDSFERSMKRIFSSRKNIILKNARSKEKQMKKSDFLGAHFKIDKNALETKLYEFK